MLLIVVPSNLREKGGCREVVPFSVGVADTAMKGYLTVEENINKLKEYIPLKRIYTSVKIMDNDFSSHLGMCC